MGIVIRIASRRPGDFCQKNWSVVMGVTSVLRKTVYDRKSGILIALALCLS
jgi:hypothetical protein